jgi:hypothetical protein
MESPVYASDEDTDPDEDEDLASDGLPDEPDHRGYLRNHRYPTETHIAPPKSGSRNIALKEQPSEIKEVVTEGVLLAQKHLLFKSPYISTDRNYKSQRRLLYTAATDLGYASIADRLEIDKEYGVQLARLVCFWLFVCL